jgi:AraC-like DNA-binding protein
MLHTRRVISLEGLEVADIACRHQRGKGVPEEAPRHGVGFVRRGCFVRSGESGEELLDPSAVFFVNPGAEQRYDHPHSGGDDCTAFLLEPELLALLWGGDPVLPAEPLHIPSRLDLEHRLLLAEADKRGASADEIGERAILLIARVLEHSDPLRPQSGRPMKGSPQRALIDDARESLAADPSQSLLALARSLAVSPHHLSRLFRAATGHTLSRHRMRLRVRAALERLTDGEHNLARLAADLDFADHSHLCRVIRDETGSTPSSLRDALRAPDDPRAMQIDDMGPTSALQRTRPAEAGRKPTP